ncbi:MAG: DUF1552 domain-containing protein, partial [Deltaproteobacteria bacterium]|nr:DUF1552 domain-containing protein [Deltaproteobacteria bacterium]
MRSSMFQPSRRMLLRSAAACLPLPLLPSLLSREARAATLAAPKRLLFFFVPCGLQPEEMIPDRVGAGYDLKRILVPLAGVQSHVSVLSGLEQGAGDEDRAGDHARGTGAFLTATTPKFTAGADIENGISVDQIAAQQLGAATLLPSLQLGTEEGGTVGDCASGYSCAYLRNISWSGTTTPLPSIIDPGVAFSRMFSGMDLSVSTAEIERRKTIRSSILDHVLDQANSLHSRMGRSDQLKLDEYTTGVRELELKIQSLAESVCVPGEEPPPEYDTVLQVTLMMDMMAMAFECDITRHISFMLGNGGSNRSFPWLGVSGAHHEISHHMDEADNLEQLYAINTWEVEQYA